MLNNTRSLFTFNSNEFLYFYILAIPCIRQEKFIDKYLHIRCSRNCVRPRMSDSTVSCVTRFVLTTSLFFNVIICYHQRPCSFQKQEIATGAHSYSSVVFFWGRMINLDLTCDQIFSLGRSTPNTMNPSNISLVSQP